MPSYGSDSDFAIYLASTGRTLPIDIVPAVLRMDGTLWVDQWENRFRSTALTDTNSFPRIEWPIVPERVEQASYEAAWAVSQGIDIWGAPVSAGAGNVVQERVDVLSVTYAGVKSTDAWDFYDAARLMLPRAYALLVPYLRRNDTIAAAFVV